MLLSDNVGSGDICIFKKIILILGVKAGIRRGKNSIHRMNVKIALVIGDK